jgi:hypothetical protein
MFDVEFWMQDAICGKFEAEEWRPNTEGWKSRETGRSNCSPG